MWHVSTCHSSGYKVWSLGGAWQTGLESQTSVAVWLEWFMAFVHVLSYRWWEQRLLSVEDATLAVSW